MTTSGGFVMHAWVGLVFACLTSCTDQLSDAAQAPRNQRVLTSLLAPPGATAMRAFATQDTFPQSDSVRIAYVVRTGRGWQPFFSEPGFFKIEVFDHKGALVPPLVRQPGYTGTPGTVPRVQIPDQGLFGQVLSLSCGRPGLVDPDGKTCWWEYRINQGGAYKAVLSYTPYEFGVPDAATYPRLRSDTVRFFIAQ
jgi:hypothetical protein